jgi:hypothetical protein
LLSNSTFVPLHPVFDYVAAAGEPEEQGVVVNVRPGPLSAVGLCTLNQVDP